MEENQKPGQRVITRVKRVVECHNCGNDNLVHGLHLAKVDNIMKVGGPGQIPTTVGDRWAVYLCMECNAIYPYPKQYPGNETLRKIYNQIFQWCDQKAKKRKSIDEAIEQLNSIISANKELLGLPGLSKDEAIEKTIAPLWEEIDNLKKEMQKRKGGRPRICKKTNCKKKAVPGSFYCARHTEEGEKP